MKSLWRLDAADIAGLIRARSISCVEALEAALERLEDHDDICLALAASIEERLPVATPIDPMA